MKFTSECQNLKNLSCKVQEEGESASQIKAVCKGHENTWDPTPWAEAALQIKTLKPNYAMITFGWKERSSCHKQLN